MFSKFSSLPRHCHYRFTSCPCVPVPHCDCTCCSLVVCLQSAQGTRHLLSKVMKWKLQPRLIFLTNVQRVEARQCSRLSRGNSEALLGLAEVKSDLLLRPCSNQGKRDCPNGHQSCKTASCRAGVTGNVSFRKIYTLSGLSGKVTSVQWNVLIHGSYPLQRKLTVHDVCTNVHQLSFFCKLVIFIYLYHNVISNSKEQ